MPYCFSGLNFLNHGSFTAQSNMLSAASNSAHSRHSRDDSVIRHKSGYEPSDTETEWQESPWNDAVLTSERTRLPKDPGRNTHVPNHIREYHDDKTSNLRNNQTPPRVTEQRRQPSPYKKGSPVHVANLLHMLVEKMNHARRAAEHLPDFVLPWKALVGHQSRRGLPVKGNNFYTKNAAT